LKTPRLVPTLIVAATALLVFKTIGLVTDGGYVLVGTSTAIAAGGGGDHGGAAPAEGEAAADGAFPGEHTMEDSSPTLADTDETLPLEAEDAGGHGGTADHGADAGTHEDDAAHAEGEAPAEPAADPAATDAAVLPTCPTEEAPADDGHGGGAAEAPADCIPAVQSDLPVILDGTGAVIPMVDSTVGASQPLLIERLGERREALASQEAELEMRLTLMEAAEKRLDQRTAELKALEARIGAMVDQQKADEREQFVSLVAMYESMKPKEAALIFDALDLPVLVRVAQAMSPKKMGPIMAKMDPNKAKSLTSMLVAAETPKPEVAQVGAGELPQIVGQ
jgi:flagellar motility protein MotE (MotC chaperone)